MYFTYYFVQLLSLSPLYYQPHRVRGLGESLSTHYMSDPAVGIGDLEMSSKGMPQHRGLCACVWVIWGGRGVMRKAGTSVEAWRKPD